MGHSRSVPNPSGGAGARLEDAHQGVDDLGRDALVREVVLVDGLDRRIMATAHPQADLAPRDVVAAAISEAMAGAPGGVGDHGFLDATHLGERFYERFPSITEACRRTGGDPAIAPIPVAPAAHSHVGVVDAERQRLLSAVAPALEHEQPPPGRGVVAGPHASAGHVEHQAVVGLDLPAGGRR